MPGFQIANGTSFAYFNTTNDLRDGAFHHVVATLNRSATNGGHLYVDGMAKITFNPTVIPGSLSNAAPVRIGVHPQPGLNGWYKGVIDEVTIYRRALSDSEIITLSNSGLPGGPLLQTNSEITALYSAGSAGKCKTDTDGDGLSDLQEAFLGTNPNNPDSDGDGLTEGDEVFTYHTNPKNPDTDGDGLSDREEVRVYHTNPNVPETDGDGLTDKEELTILIDASNPGLGHLDPLDPDTGNTGVPDGQKDGDHDSLSNLAERRQYGSDPSVAHSLNPAPGGPDDGEYLFAARGVSGESPGSCTCPWQATLHITNLGSALLQFSISHKNQDGTPNPQAGAGKTYDLYFVNSIEAAFYPEQRWKWRRIYSGIKCDSNGDATFTLKQPDPSLGYFVILEAGDDDLDGLSNGYECWFTYLNSAGQWQPTCVNNPNSDGDRASGDGLWDGWEVEYGLNPMDKTTPNGSNDDPDNDGNKNWQEHDNYFSVPLGSFDPLKNPNNPNTPNRPVVSMSPSPEYPFWGTNSFTITRNGGSAADYSQPLFVYYSIRWQPPLPYGLHVGSGAEHHPIRRP